MRSQEINGEFTHKEMQTVNHHMEKCSVSIETKEMRTKELCNTTVHRLKEAEALAVQRMGCGVDRYRHGSWP